MKTRTLLNVGQVISAACTLLPVLAIAAGYVMPGLDFLVSGSNEAMLWVAAVSSLLSYAAMVRLGVDHEAEGGDR